MTNLLSETLEALEDNGLTVRDVRWVGSADGKMAMEWGDFAKLAEGVEYDKWSGHQEIACDLVVVGDDWWLERYTYDGSERWDIKRRPTRSDTPAAFQYVDGGWWDDLAKLNGVKAT